MKIAFVGIEKDWEDLERRDYVREFIQYHLELPWYYAKHGNNDVDIVSDYWWEESVLVDNPLRVVPHYEFMDCSYDVVVHWRKWLEECYRPEAINVINSQDHSYGREWLQNVEAACMEEKLHGILCFPTWHERNLTKETVGMLERPLLLPGMTLGVDTTIYSPSPEKNRHQLLWASDPGRGIQGAYEIAMKLFQRDRRYRLHVCWPDYAHQSLKIQHPAVVYHGNLDNGPELWSLFNESAFLPYTSEFMEPSSRAHRQAMAAGCVVLYPPGRGSPSELLSDGIDAIVRPIDEWVGLIERYTSEDNILFTNMSNAAREHAVRENWQVQAERFNEYFKGLRG